MATEIERKFLVTGSHPMTDGVEMVQGYLSRDIDRIVRVRSEGDRCVLTIKGRSVGISRPEFEYEIPADDTKELMKLAVGSLIKKTRYHHRAGKHTWEIDVFQGENAGLTIAEIELASEDEDFKKPDWVGQEVSEDRRYTNAALSENPYNSW